MMPIKTDADIINAAKRIDEMRDKITDLLEAIGESEHPNAEAIKEALYEQCWFPAWAVHVVKSHLNKPDEWAYEQLSDGSNGEPYHIAAKKAQKTRRTNKYRGVMVSNGRVIR